MADNPTSLESDNVEFTRQALVHAMGWVTDKASSYYGWGIHATPLRGIVNLTDPDGNAWGVYYVAGEWALDNVKEGG
jgi:hypothetical protein